MATEINIGYDITVTAAADLSASQHFFVKADGNLVSVAGAQALGILQNDPTSGQAGSVRVMGVSKLKLAGTVAVGDGITSDSAGKGVKYTAASVSAGTPEPLAGSHVMAIALRAGVSGDVIDVALIHAGLSN